MCRKSERLDLVTGLETGWLAVAACAAFFAAAGLPLGENTGKCVGLDVLRFGLILERDARLGALAEAFEGVFAGALAGTEAGVTLALTATVAAGFDQACMLRKKLMAPSPIFPRLIQSKNLRPSTSGPNPISQCVNDPSKTTR